MNSHDGLGPARRTHGERLAVRRRDAALLEQAQRGEALQRAAGTSAEQSSFVRLEAASLHVSRCDRAVKNPPSPGAREAIALGDALTFSVDGGPQAPARARHALRDQFGPKLDAELLELADLLLSEVVTNCVLHGAASAPGSSIEVFASIFPHVLWVEVSDGGPAFKHVPRLPSADVDSARGLYLVQQVASGWGITTRDAAASVWFELPVDASAK